MPIIIKTLIYSKENSILLFFLLSAIHFAFDFKYILMLTENSDRSFYKNNWIDYLSFGIITSGIFTFLDDSRKIYNLISNLIH